MRDENSPGWTRALGLIPESLFVMTSAFERHRSCILVHWVQQCGFDPPMISVALRKGRPIEPIIRDSHSFALCRIAPDDRLLLRKLRQADEHRDDVLDTLEIEKLRTGAPCLVRSVMALDCEVVRHVDLEGDHELYVGQIIGAKIYDRQLVDEASASLAESVLNTA